MFKRIIYLIVIIVVIIMLAILWSGSKNEEILPENQASTTEVNENITQNVAPISIGDELNSIDVNSGIDADLNAINTDIKTL